MNNISVLLTEEQINARIAEIGAQISKDYEGEEIFMVCTLKGACFFACELAKRITLPVAIDFMSVSSYGNSTVSGGKIRMKKDLEESIVGKNVLVIEDIVDTGRTLSYLMELLRGRGPKSLKLCALLDKPERRVVDIKADYTGFEIEDLFVVGYGLDYAQRYRNLPYVGVIEVDE